MVSSVWLRVPSAARQTTIMPGGLGSAGRRGRDVRQRPARGVQLHEHPPGPFHQRVIVARGEPLDRGQMGVCGGQRDAVARGRRDRRHRMPQADPLVYVIDSGQCPHDVDVAGAVLEARLGRLVHRDAATSGAERGRQRGGHHGLADAGVGAGHEHDPRQPGDGRGSAGAHRALATAATLATTGPRATA